MVNGLELLVRLMQKEFIKGTNVDQLTIAFLKNFERAGVEKTQARITAAKNGLTSY